MARNILIRFNSDETLVKLIDEFCQRLGVTGTALARMAIFDYCTRLQSRGNNGNSK